MSTATVNGVDLAYVEQGQGEPVLFVHGGSGDYRVWEQQMDAFGAGHRAVALSCRGSWPNPKLRPDEPITLDTFVDDLAGFIRALDAGPVHLIGHSSPGGFGSLLLAARHPELLRTLVLLEPPVFPLLGVDIPPRPAQVIRLLVRHPRAGIGFVRFGAKGIGPAGRAFARGDDAAGLRVFMAANSSRADVDGIPDEVFQRLLDNVGPLKAQIRAGFPPFTAADARAVRVPTLLVSGTRSPTTLTTVTDRLAKLVPDAERLTIAGATHNMFVSHPEEFNAGVLRFISSHARDHDDVNQAQRRYWDTKGARLYRDHEDTGEAMLAPFGESMLLAARLRPGEVVLDVGCGHGTSTLDAAERVGPSGRVVGVDISGAMLEPARRCIAATGLGNVELIRADAQRYRFETASFDAVVSRFGMMFFEDQHAAFGNLARALRSGGRLVFVCPREPLRSEWVAVAFKAAVAAVGRTPQVGSPGTPGTFALVDGDRLTRLLVGVGFEDVALESVTRPVRLGRHLDGAVEYILSLPESEQLFTDAPQHVLDTARAALGEAFAPHLGPTGVVMDATAWLVSARRNARDTS